MAASYKHIENIPPSYPAMPILRKALAHIVLIPEKPWPCIYLPIQQPCRCKGAVYLKALDHTGGSQFIFPLVYIGNALIKSFIP